MTEKFGASAANIASASIDCAAFKTPRIDALEAKVAALEAQIAAMIRQEPHVPVRMQQINKQPRRR